MPPVVTTVPAVLLALVHLAQTTLPATVTVYDGAPNTDNPGDDFIVIGDSRDEDESSVDGSTSDEGNYTSSEAYSVRCILSSATGDAHPTAVAERRAAAATLWGLFAGALRTDPTLGGVLTGGGRAVLGSWSWVYGPSTQAGVYAEVQFDVDVTAGWLGMA